MANDFSGDTHCKALWKFDDNALITDSIGTNTLTNDGVDEELVEIREGTGCGSWIVANTDYMYRADADLNSGFPLKNGETNKTFSVCAWVYANTFGADNIGRTIFSKFDYTLNKMSVLLSLMNRQVPNENNAQFIMGYNGGASYEEVFHDTNLSVETWYHITVSHDSATKAYAIRIRDTGGNVIGADLTGNFTNAINVEDAAFAVGAYYDNGSPVEYFNGLIDEMVIFDDIITAGEATLIAKGYYGRVLKLSAGSGSYALTGQALSLLKTNKLPIEGGSYTLTGQNVGLLLGREIVAGAGDYALTGSAIGVYLGREIAAEAGDYVLTGSALTLKKTNIISIGAGSYILTGSDLGLFKDRILPIEGGSYLLTGTALNLLLGREIVPEAASYLLTGTDAMLTYSGLGKRLNAESGAYLLTENALDLFWGRKVIVEAGSYLLNGSAAGLFKGRMLAVEIGSYLLTGQALNLLRGMKISAEADLYLLSGADLSFSRSYLIAIDSGTYVLTGANISLLYGALAAYILPAEAGNYTLTGYPVTFLYTRLQRLEKVIYALLSGDAELATLVSTRIYPNMIPQNQPLPAVIYFRISNEQTPLMGIDSLIKQTRIQISIFAASLKKSREIAKEIRSILQRYGGSIIQNIFIEGEYPIYEPDTRVYQIAQNYLVQHTGD